MTPQASEEILQGIYDLAAATLKKSVIADKEMRKRVDYVCRCMSNRAGVRLLMSCLLGKMDNPKVDPRKPYTEIGGFVIAIINIGGDPLGKCRYRIQINREVVTEFEHSRPDGLAKCLFEAGKAVERKRLDDTVRMVGYFENL